MPGALPLGEPAPADGRLPLQAAQCSQARPFGVYVHVPFCRVRCGYCDFNTYTSSELAGASPSVYPDQVKKEIAFAAGALRLSGIDVPPVSTIFFGGGTPTLLPSEDLAGIARTIRETWECAPQVEVTTEANPDSIDESSLAILAAGGFTRVSLGMQSAVRHVLETLDRTHDPDRVATVVDAVKAVGLQVSVDLIYGTPGESLDDWEASVDAAIAMGPDHISAYALIVEEGTRLARQIRSGAVPAPDNDLQADMYELADERFSQAGYRWYELSNWSRGASTRSRHNEMYWRSANWWGFGPGAHSHVGGVRWWNVKHPTAYSARISDNVSPAAAREVLTAPEQGREEILLRIRLREGLPLSSLSGRLRSEVDALVNDGLVVRQRRSLSHDNKAAEEDYLVLTLRGRLLADVVTHRLTVQPGE